MNVAPRILVIDDDPAMREVIREQVLRELPGASLHDICTKEEFDEAVAKRDFDLVITDYDMPWMNGLAVLRSVKEVRPDCPVIMFTGTGSEEIAVEGMKAGLDDYILKSPKHVIRMGVAVRAAMDRREERKARIEAETRYRDLFDHIPVGLYRTAPDGTILAANAALAEMVGYPNADSLIGVNAATDFYVTPEERKRWIAQAQSEGVVSGHEMRFRRKDGEVIWVRNSVRAIRDADGEMVCYEGANENVTAQKRMERFADTEHATTRVLAESATLAEAIPSLLKEVCEGLDCDLAGFWTSDPQTNVLRCLGVWQQPSVSFPNFEMLTRQMTIPFGGDIPGTVWQSEEPVWIDDISDYTSLSRAPVAAIEGIHGALAFPILSPGGVVGVIEIFSRKERWPDRGAQLMLTNVGSQIGRFMERKRVEEELKQALARAEAADRLKNVFLGTMSHEIRTPLNIITGYCELIRQDLIEEGDDSKAPLLDAIQRASQRLIRTVHGMLDMAALQAGSFNWNPAPLRLGPLMEKQVEEFQPMAREKGLTLSCTIVEPQVIILFDEYCFSQSLYNLIENALKFTSEGTISVRLFRGANKVLSIEVRDSGMGMDESYLSRLFEPFSQAEAGYSRGFEGSGLGLALVKRYLEVGGARVSVQSRKGQGTSFTIHFDRACEVNLTPGKQDQALRKKSPVSSPLAPERPARLVLVVEDEPDHQSYIRAILDRQYRILTAASAEGARRELTAHAAEISVILMDLSLRGSEDGLMLTRAIRQNPEWAGIPVIAVTAHALPEDRARVLGNGCDAVLVKPFKPADLVSAMDEALSSLDR